MGVTRKPTTTAEHIYTEEEEFENSSEHASTMSVDEYVNSMIEDSKTTEGPSTTGAAPTKAATKAQTKAQTTTKPVTRKPTTTAEHIYTEEEGFENSSEHASTMSVDEYVNSMLEDVKTTALPSTTGAPPTKAATKTQTTRKPVTKKPTTTAEQ